MSFTSIAECLASTLSSDTNTRVSAELKLSELLVFPGVLYLCAATAQD